ncbi:UDP-N-acetylmuramoyl-L-alanine--D-glutamate ligase [Faecalicoccus pleomorphus]|uniref:UDP-N-acetylmuramoyl-L-alanine--D-glutamate ligase n=1 Tax=Faecalicoccus pleomorphus TaxID=1323 RepID=UPI003DA3511F
MEKVLVIGAARSGIAVTRLLCKMGYEVYLTDQKEIAQKEQIQALGVHVFDQGHPDELKEIPYAFVVKNPGIPYRAAFVHYFVKKQVPIYTEIEIAYRYAKNFSYAAVTGTDGKTTVTTLLYEMLKTEKNALVAGNIGIPLSELALEYNQKDYAVALELSNFQLLGIESFAPSVCVVTNLAPDHLDYMDSLEDYYQSKMKIYENCKPDAWFIRNVDDEEIRKHAKNIPCEVIDFSLTRQDVALHRDEKYAYLNDTILFKLDDLKIVGGFNCGNAMMAACMAYRMGVSVESIQKVISSFKGVEHRIEYVDTIKGVRIYNDSKATNTHAACAALSAFDQNVILLCGGKDKHISFEDLKQYDQKIKHCFSFGQTKDHFKEIFTHQTSCETMEEALRKAYDMASKGDVILLSPACSSFDQFKNFEVRGEIFKELVEQLKEKEN